VGVVCGWGRGGLAFVTQTAAIMYMAVALGGCTCEVLVTDCKFHATCRVLSQQQRCAQIRLWCRGVVLATATVSEVPCYLYYAVAVATPCQTRLWFRGCTCNCNCKCHAIGKRGRCGQVCALPVAAGWSKVRRCAGLPLFWPRLAARSAGPDSTGPQLAY
jgi:hypothetical protein